MNESKNYTLLVFDWDGTITDSEGMVIKAIQKISEDLDYEIPEAKHISSHFGKGLTGMLDPFFPKSKHNEIAEEFYKNFTIEKLAASFFEGAIETLEHLKEQGFTLAVATNRPRTDLDAVLTASNTGHLFSTTRCPEEGAPKPDPTMLISILDELNDHSAQNTLMIGDSIFDMQFAQNANIDAIAACYGGNRKDQLTEFEPVKIIDDIRELKNFLKK